MKNNILHIIIKRGIYSFPLLLILLGSCENREDYFYTHIDPPTIMVSKNLDTTYFVSLNDSVKLGNAFLFNFKYYSKGKANFSIKTIDQDSFVLNSNRVKFIPKKTGDRKIRVIITDPYDRQKEAVITLFTYKNLPPVPVITAKAIKDLSEKYLLVDASRSFEIDSIWGGRIITYEYTINNIVYTNSLNSIRQSVYSNGQKKISVRVQDNDGAWSDYKTTYVTF